jgi:hypothetical protein
MKRHLAAACVAVLLTSSTALAQHPTRGKTDRHAERALEGLAGLEASLAGLEASLAGLECKIARLEHMVATETPVSTRTTSEGTVRVYRDGTRVTDSGGNRSFQQDDAVQRAHRSRSGTRGTTPEHRTRRTPGDEQPACAALPTDSAGY